MIENAMVILKQIGIMFLYMGIGWILFRKKLVSKEGSKSMAHLLLYMILPCVIIKSFCREQTPEQDVYKRQGFPLHTYMTCSDRFMIREKIVAHCCSRVNVVSA